MRNVVRGVFLLATGRVQGIARFGSDARAVTAALAPFLALIAVGLALTALQPREQWVPQSLPLLLSLVAVLLQLALSELCARFWRRSFVWYRYAAASLWCLWPQSVLAGFASLLPDAPAGLPYVSLALRLCALVYGLWLDWLVARAGLAVSAWKAGFLVALFNGTVLLLMGLLRILPPHYDGMLDVFGVNF